MFFELGKPWGPLFSMPAVLVIPELGGVARVKTRGMNATTAIAVHDQLCFISVGLGVKGHSRTPFIEWSSKYLA